MIEGRKKIFIYLSIVVLFLLAIILLYFVFRKPAVVSPVQNTTPTSTPSTASSTTQPQVFVPIKNIPPPPPATTEERERLYVKQLARTFVERFETYSNQNKNRNITDATELATSNMAGYIATKSQEQGTEYQGVTTKVISMDVADFSGESATVTVGAQVDAQTKDSAKTTYKNGRVELKKIEGTWKINGVFWDAPTP